jgi:hypothetical protein
MIPNVRSNNAHAAHTLLAYVLGPVSSATANCIEFVLLGGPAVPVVGDDIQIGFRFAHQSTDISAINLSLVATGDLEFTSAVMRGDIYDEALPYATYLNAGGSAVISPSNLVSGFDWLSFGPGEIAPIAALETFNDAQGLNGDAGNGFSLPGLLGIVNVYIIGTGGGTINFAGSLVDGNLIGVTLSSVSVTSAARIVGLSFHAMMYREKSSSTVDSEDVSLGLGHPNVRLLLTGNTTPSTAYGTPARVLDRPKRDSQTRLAFDRSEAGRVAQLLESIPIDRCRRLERQTSSARFIAAHHPRP